MLAARPELQWLDSPPASPRGAEGALLDIAPPLDAGARGVGNTPAREEFALREESSFVGIHEEAPAQSAAVQATAAPPAVWSLSSEHAATLLAAAEERHARERRAWELARRELTQHVQTLTQRLDALAAVADSTRAQHAVELERLLRAREMELAATQTRLRASETRALELEGAAEAAEAQLADAQQRLARQVADLQQRDAELRAAGQETLALRGEVRSLQHELQIARAQATAQSEALARASHGMDDLRQRLSATEAEARNARAEAAELRRAFEQERRLREQGDLRSAAAPATSAVQPAQPPPVANIFAAPFSSRPVRPPPLFSARPPQPAAPQSGEQSPGKEVDDFVSELMRDLPSGSGSGGGGGESEARQREEWAAQMAAELEGQTAPQPPQPPQAPQHRPQSTASRLPPHLRSSFSLRDLAGGNGNHGPTSTAPATSAASQPRPPFATEGRAADEEVQALERRMARVSLARDRMAAALAKLPEAPRTREQRTQRAEIVRDMADADRALTELRAQARALQASR